MRKRKKRACGKAAGAQTPQRAYSLFSVDNLGIDVERIL